jgi:hypothetical protein
MNLLMCCTPIGREDRYLEELRYVTIASIFFREVYPEGKVFIGTTPNAVIPTYLEKFFEPRFFPFDKIPFALARQLFYKEFINSKDLNDDTLITGCDVLILKKMEIDPIFQMAMTYRYHRTMPYCSDLLYVKNIYKNIASEFCQEVAETMRWHPKEIQNGWADQLSIAIQLGFLKKDDFNGELQKSPNNNNIGLYPGDLYLYTPNDYFSSNYSKDTNSTVNDTPDTKSLLNHFHTKNNIHFKGGRKSLFFIFAYLCKINKIIDFDKYNVPFSDDFLFKEYFEMKK